MNRVSCLIILFMLTIISGWGQAPTRNYGEYKYAYSFDEIGNAVEANTFLRIQPVIVTTNFGFVQSSASYMYMGIGGVWLNSAPFEWAGFQNGWYVYAYRIGPQYSYFLISRDFDTIRISENFHNGVTHVYSRCDPNEKMNNAPTY